MSQNGVLRLGLIGDHIDRSRSPLLHRLAGLQYSMRVQYDRLVPADLERSFEEVFGACASEGYRGINVTYPYKERAARLVALRQPALRSVGAVNTVLFERDGARGENTDQSGFVEAYRRIRETADPGPTLIIGTGGVGRAIAFGLVQLGCTDLRLADRDIVKAEALSRDLLATGADVSIHMNRDAANLAPGSRGLINCTPVGMVGHEGTPLPAAALLGAEWAFDAVYTPVKTEFLLDAEAAQLAVISGWELFFFQGVHAWKHFTGLPLDEVQLRKSLAEEAQ